MNWTRLFVVTSAVMFLGLSSVVPEQAHSDVQSQQAVLVQLNAWREYAYTREELIAKIDAALEAEK